MPPDSTSTDAIDVTCVRRPRKRLWEIKHGHHCALLGTCLSLRETRKILKKAGFEATDGASDYEVHCTAVDLAQHAGRVARLLDKALNRTHARVIARYGRLESVDAVRGQWRADVEENAVAGPLWAVLQHPETDAALEQEVFGFVHMLSHRIGGTHRSKLRRYEHMCQQVAAARDEGNGRAAQHARTVARLEQRLRELDDALTAQKRETLDWRRRAEAADIDRVRGLEDERDHRIRALARADRQLSEARATIDALTAEVTALRAAASGAVSTDSPEPGLDPAAPSAEPARLPCDLAGGTVLYVGGERALVPHLRRATENANGAFLYHDGGLEDGLRALPKLCARADVVLCPTSKVGHMAVDKLRRRCRIDCKAFIALRRASLDAYQRGLGQAAAQLAETAR